MLLAIATFAVAASMPVIDSIRIESRWGGLGKPRDDTYVVDIQQSRKAVAALAAAITAAPVGRQAALREIATPEWLAHVHEDEDHSLPTCSDEAKRLFERRLADPAFARQMLDEYYSLRWTDDYPAFSVDVTFHGGRKVHIESHAQQALMLPWSVDGVQTWNPDLARSIAAILPANVEPRLRDATLVSALVQQVSEATRDEIEPLEEACLHRAMVAAAVKRAFEIVRIYHGSPGDFTAYVRRREFPRNLVFTLVIRGAEDPGAIERLDRTAQHIGAYVELVRPFVDAHPRQQFALWYVDGDAEAQLEDYDPRSGIVSNPRRVLPGRGIVEDAP